jgi:hypothetical protein
VGGRLGPVQRHRTVNIEDLISWEGVVPSKRSFLWARIGRLAVGQTIFLRA